jgi:hypothetical protein
MLMGNQELSYPGRRVHSTSYFQELQVEKRRLEEESNSLRELNHYLGMQRGCSNKRTEGLESLMQLYKLLDEQNNSLKQEYSNRRIHHPMPATSYFDY